MYFDNTGEFYRCVMITISMLNMSRAVLIMAHGYPTFQAVCASSLLLFTPPSTCICLHVVFVLYDLHQWFVAMTLYIFKFSQREYTKLSLFHSSKNINNNINNNKNKTTTTNNNTSVSEWVRAQHCTWARKEEWSPVWSVPLMELERDSEGVEEAGGSLTDNTVAFLSWQAQANTQQHNTSSDRLWIDKETNCIWLKWPFFIPYGKCTHALQCIDILSF